MTAPTGLNDLVSALTASDVQHWSMYKAQIAAQTQLGSSWGTAGCPAPGAAPGTTAAICTRSTVGGFPFTPATSGKTLKLVQIALLPSTLGIDVILCDRIWHVGGLDATNTGLQTVSSPALPSDRGILADRSDLIFMSEVYATIGSTLQNMTVNYNKVGGGTGSRVSGSGLSGSSTIGNLRLVIQGIGDMIEDINTIQLAGSTGLAGNFGMTCYKPLLMPMSALDKNAIDMRDWLDTCPTIYDNTCLVPMLHYTGSNVFSQFELLFTLVQI